MFDYLLDCVVRFQSMLLNESSLLVRKHLISLIQDLLKELPDAFKKQELDAPDYQ